MTHCMAMAVIEMPETVYKFEGQEPYTVFSATAEFNGNCQPRLMSDGSYSYLVNPVAPYGDVILTGNYDDGNREFAITPSNATAGNYKTFKVDGGYREITLQVGDFYMKDGTLLSKDTKLTEAQKADCIGIVFWVGDATATDMVLKSDFPQCTHGLVVSLNEATSVWQETYNSQLSIQSWAEKQDFYKSGGYKALNYNVISYPDNLGVVQGYNNTQILKEYDKAFAESCPVTILDCFSTITDGVTLPDGKTSGWYLPSPMEVYEFYKIMGEILKSLSALGSNSRFSISNYYSSGESNAYSVWCMSMSYGDMPSYTKTFNCSVRLVFAF